MSASAVSRMERGEIALTADTILRLADALEISPNVLLGYKGKKNAEDIFRECMPSEKLYLNRIVAVADEEYHRLMKK